MLRGEKWERSPARCTLNYLRRAQTYGPHAITRAGLARLGDRVRPDDRAVDLGCGSGRDLPALLELPWRVIALDADPRACRLTRDRFPDQPSLRVENRRLETFEPPATLFVNAAASLSFLTHSAFRDVMGKLSAAMVPGAVFAGLFLGDRHLWRERHPRLTYLSESGLRDLFSGFVDVEIREEMKIIEGLDPDRRRGHEYSVIAQKPMEESHEKLV